MDSNVFTQKPFVASGVVLGSSSLHCEIVWLQNKLFGWFVW